MMKRTLITVLAAAAISTPAVVAPAIFSPAAAQVDFSLVIGTPPPPPRYELVPAPRAGHVWAPGYWQWEGGRHVWAPGRWMAERRGYYWVPDRWDQHAGGWGHAPGHWARSGGDRFQAYRDSDHDGVPDRYDAHPYNPNRR